MFHSRLLAPCMLGLLVLSLLLPVLCHAAVIGSLWEGAADPCGDTENRLYYLLPSLSYDGRYVAYTQVTWDLEVYPEVRHTSSFLCDRQTGTRQELPLLAGYTDSGCPQVSGDGRLVAYLLADSDDISLHACGNLALYDRQADSSRLLVADYVEDPSFSSDGRYLAFFTGATMEAADADGGAADIYVYDTVADTFTCLTAAASAQGYPCFWQPTISEGGNVVACMAQDPATNQWRPLVWRRETGLWSVPVALESFYRLDWLKLSGNGRYLLMDLATPGMPATELTSGQPVYDLVEGTFDVVRPQPNWGRAAISADGRYVTTTIMAGSTFQVILVDRQTGRQELLTADYGGAAIPGPWCGATLSGNGRYAGVGGVFDNTTVRVSLAITSAGPPEVLATSPADGGQLDAQPVTATFSEPMAATSVNAGTFTVSSDGMPVEGTVTLSETGRIATFTPTHPLAAGNHTATLAGGVSGMTDATGDRLPANHAWSFSVGGGPLWVTAVSPANGDTHVSPIAEMKATFSRAVDPATVTTSTCRLYGTGYRFVACTVSYDPATFTATLRPAGPLAWDGYTVAIGTGVKPLAGEPLPTTYRWTFTVPETEPPTVRITSPADGVTVSKEVVVTAEAADNVGVVRVEFNASRSYGTFTVTNPPYSLTWPIISNQTRVSEGPFNVTAVAYDAAGNASRPAAVTVNVEYTTFDDVPYKHPLLFYVETIVREGITSGCSQQPRLFCPGAALTRGQAAVLLCRAAGHSPFQPATPTFADVPASHPFYGYIERLCQMGITVGCGVTSPRRFCPDAPLSRGQAVVWLCRSRIPTVRPATPTYSDVPATSAWYPYAEGLAAKGVYLWCNTSTRRMCPSLTVTRGEMARLLCGTFGLHLFPN